MSSNATIESGTIELVDVYYADEVDLREVKGVRTYSDPEIMEMIDGAAVYEMNYTLTNDTVVEEWTRSQQFHEGEHVKEGKLNIWGWDGDRENPTLSPSFGCLGHIVDEGWGVHLFLKNGKIEPCSDMVLEVA